MFIVHLLFHNEICLKPTGWRERQIIGDSSRSVFTSNYCFSSIWTRVFPFLVSRFGGLNDDPIKTHLKSYHFTWASLCIWTCAGERVSYVHFLIFSPRWGRLPCTKDLYSWNFKVYVHHLGLILGSTHHFFKVEGIWGAELSWLL